MALHRFRPRPSVRAGALVTLLVLTACSGGGADEAEQSGSSRDQRRDTVPADAPSVTTELPVDAVLPAEESCVATVGRSASEWEPRPENRRYNARTGGPSLPEYADFDEIWQQAYRPRITGNFSGTTDEIIQWAACKWGLEPNLLRAQAFAESKWRMDSEGDPEPAASGRCVPGDSRDPCPTSFGILQNKWYFNPGSYPAIAESTAWHLDFSGAKLRGCFDGHKWIGSERPRGDIWGCIGNWFSGGWNDADALDYVERVREPYEARPWLDWETQ